jgi:hypothetical protein
MGSHLLSLTLLPSLPSSPLLPFSYPLPTRNPQSHQHSSESKSESEFRSPSPYGAAKNPSCWSLVRSVTFQELESQAQVGAESSSESTTNLFGEHVSSPVLPFLPSFFSPGPCSCRCPRAIQEFGSFNARDRFRSPGPGAFIVHFFSPARR